VIPRFAWQDAVDKAFIEGFYKKRRDVERPDFFDWLDVLEKEVAPKEYTRIGSCIGWVIPRPK
jgi:hypothetical protein